MNIQDLLASSGGLASIAKELGISDAQVKAGTQALLPAIVGGFKRQAGAQPSGMDALGGLLGQLGGGGLLDNLLSPEPTQVNRGNDVLGQIFGSKDVSRNVAQRASEQSGLSPELLKKMLPMLAMLVTGVMAKQHSGGAAPSGGGLGGLGGLLGGLLGGGQPAQGTPSGGAGGLGSMLDLDGDGNPFDDILGMVQKSMR
ncbi:MAG: DUF937 domain-containing protein [Rhodanobacteraceae bacterium]|nr:DUF937 domain-containing protein [Rhodanobacteraceae bacterium]MBL0041945.1 DUF937 domain-containing protein [Xanthomonadales bacterium]MBP6077797.1 DUF937 domain-containing protein [Xanthomonadales bacterium]MBP7623851.1 DUF937 domain-containing protein [Xanthomonadales bacterium]